MAKKKAPAKKPAAKKAPAKKTTTKSGLTQEMAIKLHEEGLSDHEIAEKYKVSTREVKTARRGG